MKFFKHRQALLLTAAACLLTVSASALELTLPSNARYCFSAADFSPVSEDEGVFITAVPNPNIATVKSGDRIIRPGDALTMDALDSLTLDSNTVLGSDATISYYTVSDGRVTTAKELRLSILPQKNEPPAPDAAKMETYKNIPCTKQLKAADPEGESVTFQLDTPPKRGTVEITPDGTCTYTPYENKVGKDKFTFIVTDASGNASEPASVAVEIRKPTDKETYADMQGDPEEYAAMWMKEAGLYKGARIGDNLCFEPDAPLTRGQFLVMVMKLVDAEAQESVSGFADEAETDDWLRPYISTALMNGMISGVTEDGSLTFRPHDQLTRAQAVVMLQNVLDLPAADSAAVFSEQEESTVPAWAESAAAALAQAGISLDAPADNEPATRRDSAVLLLQVRHLLEERAEETFYWVK